MSVITRYYFRFLPVRWRCAAPVVGPLLPAPWPGPLCVVVPGEQAATCTCPVLAPHPTTTSLSITNTNHLYPLTPIHWETPVNWRPGGLSAHFPCWCWCPLFLLARTKDPAKTSFQDRAGQRVPSVLPAAWCGWRAGVWNVMAHRHGADGTLNRHGAQSDGREEEKLCKYRKHEWNLPPRYMQIFVQNWHFERARRGSFTFLAFPPLHWSLFTLFTSSNTSITLKHLTEHAEAV